MEKLTTFCDASNENSRSAKIEKLSSSLLRCLLLQLEYEEALRDNSDAFSKSEVIMLQSELVMIETSINILGESFEALDASKQFNEVQVNFMLELYRDLKTNDVQLSRYQGNGNIQSEICKIKENIELLVGKLDKLGASEKIEEVDMEVLCNEEIDSMLAELKNLKREEIILTSARARSYGPTVGELTREELEAMLSDNEEKQIELEAALVAFGAKDKLQEVTRGIVDESCKDLGI